MPIFTYSALQGDKSYVKGNIRGWSAADASRRLERKGHAVISVKKEYKKKWWDIVVFSPITRQDRIYLTRHLHSFIDAGVSLNQAIKIASEQVRNPKMKQILREAHTKIVAGQKISDALAPHAKDFSHYFINLIKVGEESGTLDKSLEHLLEQQEREYELLSNIRGALIYPLLIILAAIAVVIFMMIFVIPTVAAVLTENGGSLPWTTRALVATSNFFVAYSYYIFPAIVAFIFVLRVIGKTKPGKRFFEAIIFRLPIFNRIMVEFNLARFCRAISAPLLSGISIVRALDLAAGSCANSHYQTALKQGGKFVNKGIPLSEVLSGHPKLITPNVIGMVEIGEKTGRIDHMFIKLALFYEKSVFNTFKNITSVVEPLILVFVGFVVGFIAVSVLTPIWNFAETI